MVGLAEIALNTAPIFGGALLAVSDGQFKRPDYRAIIKQDMDLLDRLPPDATERRADLQRTIDSRIDDLVNISQRNRVLRQAAASYQGNWRDLVLLLCVVLFTFVWWCVSHSRANWLPTFIALIVLSCVAAVYAGRGVLRAITSLLARGQDQA